MPQPTPLPIATRRCPACGDPMFLSVVEPTYQRSYDVRTFECTTCTYAEFVLVNFDQTRGTNTPASESSSMRPSRFLTKTSRGKRKPDSGFRQYRKVAAAERKRAIERIFGSHGPASAVRKIDPKTGQVVAIIDAH